MPIIKLEMYDENQADEVRRMLQQKLPEARVEEGVRDALGGDLNPDKHIKIDYHDQQLVENILEDHFSPRGHDWREFKRS